MDYFEIVPTNITLDILTRLPAECVMECKSVCTGWNKIVSHHPSFYKMHLNLHTDSTGDDFGKQSFLSFTNDDNFYYLESNENTIERIRRMNFTPPFKRFRFISSCKGLICLVQERSVCICNPITREYVILPEIITDDMGLCWISGFCYVSSTNEYKVLRIYSVPWKVYVYTLGSGSGWRKLDEFNYTFCVSYIHCTFANEAVYWMDDKLKMICSFDFVEEKICEHLSPPPLPPKSDWFRCHIGVLDGVLYFTSNVEDDKLHDLWLLKTKDDDHGSKGGWSQEFKIDKSRLLAVVKSYRVFNLHWYHLGSYDARASESKRLVELENRRCLVIPHKNSLVSLKELGEQDTETMESVEGDIEP